jgi:Rnl2 family RNA ligase
MFQSYDKIPESARRWTDDEAALRRLHRLKWVATEKIHGANFCFVVGAAGARGARRKALLDPGEDFFSHRAVQAGLEEGLRALWRELGSPEGALVYGELYGGGYPHPDVAPAPGVSPVQTGCWYAPGIHFMAFDLAVIAGGERRWIGFEEARGRLVDAGVPCVAPLFIGGFADACAQPVAFETTLPALHGLPPLDDNLAEGFVVKPLGEALLPDGRRPVVKIKHPRFAEDARYHQARAPEREPHAPEVAPLDALEWAVLSRMTPPRLQSARSKLGPSAPAGALAAEVARDVSEDLEEAEGALLAGLSAEDRALVEGLVEDEARALVAAG